MRKVIFSMNITLNGFIEGPQHELDWSIADDDLQNYYARMLSDADMIIFGRVTYELMANYWPTASNDPNATQGMLNFAKAINPLRKIVFSKSLQYAGWNTSVMNTLIPDVIYRMKAEPGRDIILGGGAAIAQAFFKQGLVDEIRLVVHPVAIGAGKALFQGIEGGMKLKYLSSQAFHSGAVVLCYQLDGKM
jgi:dihydrofolate reductase